MLYTPHLDNLMTVRIGYRAGEVCHDLNEKACQGLEHGYESHSQERDTERAANHQAVPQYGAV